MAFSQAAAHPAPASSSSPSSSPSLYSTSIACLDQRFTFSYPSSPPSFPPPSPPPPFLLFIRVESLPSPSFLLTVTDISNFYQLRVDADTFDSIRQSSMFTATSTHHLCDLMSTAITANTPTTPRITHTTSPTTLTLTFTVIIAGARMLFSYTLPPLMSRGLDEDADRPDEGKDAGDRAGSRKRKKGPAVDYADSLDFPDLDFLSPTSPPPQGPQSERFSPSLYRREMTTLLHSLLKLQLSTASPASNAVVDLHGANARLEAELEGMREEVERLRRDRGGDGGLGGGEGAGRNVAVKKASAVLKPADRSLLNPNVRRRRHRGIKLGE